MMTICIVDDSPIDLFLTKEYLERGTSGEVEVISYDKGYDFLYDLPNVKKIDKLLLDYNLPDISGIDILKKIEKNPKIRDVYMVTGFRLLKKMKMCDRLKKIYIKPFSLEYAREIINNG